MAFVEIPFSQLSFNPNTLIGKEWMLVTAGNSADGYNTLTASWGHLGSLWGHAGGGRNLPTAVVYIRPQRYTKQFIDREELFTLSVLDERYRPALSYLGSHSGRDGDKVARAGLTPVFDQGTTYFAQARLVLVCRKRYVQALDGSAVPEDVKKRCYPAEDYHIMYFGEVVEVLRRQ